jgi:hypothetical protein
MLALSFARDLLDGKTGLAGDKTRYCVAVVGGLLLVNKVWKFLRNHPRASDRFLTIEGVLGVWFWHDVPSF